MVLSKFLPVAGESSDSHSPVTAGESQTETLSGWVSCYGLEPVRGLLPGAACGTPRLAVFWADALRAAVLPLPCPLGLHLLKLRRWGQGSWWGLAHT